METPLRVNESSWDGIVSHKQAGPLLLRVMRKPEGSPELECEISLHFVHVFMFGFQWWENHQAGRLGPAIHLVLWPWSSHCSSLVFVFFNL